MTKGRRALLATLQVTKGRFVAARCRVSRSCVSEWASGRKRPSPAARALLWVNYEIPAESWDTHEGQPKRRNG